MKLKTLHEESWVDDWRLEDDGLWHHETIAATPEVLHDSERGGSYWKYDAVTPGLVGYKHTSKSAVVGSAIIPNYVLAAEHNTDTIDFTKSGGYGGGYLLKVQIPDLDKRSESDIWVDEWNKTALYPAGNPGVVGRGGTIEVGDEVLILIPTIVLAIYETYGTLEDYSGTVWKKHRGRGRTYITTVGT